MVFPLHVAHTIGKGIIDPKIIDDAVLLGALGGAIAWNLITWWYGLPSSSSHALVGGLLGAGISKGGFAVVQQSGVLKTAIFIVVSPVLGMILGGGMMVLVAWVFRRKRPGAHRPLVPAAAAGVGGAVQPGPRRERRAEDDGDHPGDADRQGVRSGAHAELPLWVILSCQAAMGLGTLTGGWRIVRTMGMRLTKLKPFGGFCAETGAAGMLFLASALGVPVSTTHTITGGIVGVGWVNKPARRALGRRAADRLGLALHHPVGRDHRGRALLRPARAGGLARSVHGSGADHAERGGRWRDCRRALLALLDAVDGEAELALGERLEEIALAARGPQLELGIAVGVDADLDGA